jgi:hypothetical protein
MKVSYSRNLSQAPLLDLIEFDEPGDALNDLHDVRHLFNHHKALPKA